MEGKQIRQRALELVRRINELNNRMELVRAHLTKEVWSDGKYDKEKLRQAELTLRIDANPEARDISEQRDMLMRELDDLVRDIRERKELLKKELNELETLESAMFPDYEMEMDTRL